MKLPFIENKKEDFYIRTFSSTIQSNELKWHFDEEDRIVLCENDTDWMFQADNQLPYTIIKNIPIFIPKGQYHRVIKGKNDLIIKVKKIV